MDTTERIVVRREPRKRRGVAEKRRIVEQTLEPDASVAKVARAHGVNANRVFAWRRQHRQGLLGEGHAEAASNPRTRLPTFLHIAQNGVALPERLRTNGQNRRRREIRCGDRTGK